MKYTTYKGYKRKVYYDTTGPYIVYKCKKKRLKITIKEIK